MSDLAHSVCVWGVAEPLQAIRPEHPPPGHGLPEPQKASKRHPNDIPEDVAPEVIHLPGPSLVRPQLNLLFKLLVPPVQGSPPQNMQLFVFLSIFPLMGKHSHLQTLFLSLTSGPCCSLPPPRPVVLLTQKHPPHPLLSTTPPCFPFLSVLNLSPIVSSSLETSVGFHPRGGQSKTVFFYLSLWGPPRKKEARARQAVRNLAMQRKHKCFPCTHKHKSARRPFPLKHLIAVKCKGKCNASYLLPSLPCFYWGVGTGRCKP